ncbi:hypothetical protein BCP78_0043 [Bacillus phage BCP78]|uniref:Uncharacterized protein n=3 Tax=Tsarbombavirus BCP78 TaxID=1985182 RepID=J9PRX0_9CAUD|nr:hypothetical protein BCP78_0043 [Bacillus phage BCP78]YP_009783407.1 hypothetical protein QLX27_gp034 [Bacillus phage BCU4]AQN32646.1 hypothetical protein BCP12_246 [Bacillus phage BCP12]AXU41139.1 hypothetical protein BC01_042 [Bacillus phage BC01]AEW47050.1 hypothetical protein BCP78_0043 [Bacillus phage BCP78]AEW47540.1 hypothetical protein BCU4_0034 [Bacillus phage BCU4]
MKIINSIGQIVNGEGSDTTIKFVRKYQDTEGKWKGYEFETSDMIAFQVFDENGKMTSEYVSDIFRLEIAENYALVLIGSHEEYYVMEDVDYAFDTEKLVEYVRLHEDNIEDAQADYEEWEEQEENY